MLTEHQVVRLKRDLPERGLQRGAKGTIVHLYGTGEALEVEFFSARGETLTVTTLTPSEVVPVVESKAE